MICWRAKLLSLALAVCQCSGTAKGAFGNSPEGVGLSPELLVHPGLRSPLMGRYDPRGRGARVVDSEAQTALCFNLKLPYADTNFKASRSSEPVSSRAHRPLFPGPVLTFFGALDPNFLGAGS